MAIILNWNFIYQTSDLQRSEVHIEFLYFYIYIFVCQMELYSESPVHTLTCLSVELVLAATPAQH